MSAHVIYARKSTESSDRQILSIDSQIQELKVLAMRRGVEVAEILTEAHSAKAPGRPIFGQLMRRIHRGEIAGILCWKMDRLARNHLDTGQVLQALADGKLQAVVTPERTFTADGNDRFLGNFELGIATKFIDDLRANVRRGNRARLQRGWPNYRPPLGYMEDRATKTIVKDPERFPLVRRMWDLLLTGSMRPRLILKLANEEWGLRTRKTARQGGKPLADSWVFKMFANPYYMGLIRQRSGETHKGAHESMVTAEEFERAQEILGRPGRPRPSHHEFAYAGMLRCGRCAGLLTGEQHVKPSGRRYVYYRCHGHGSQPCREPAIPESRLEEKILKDIKRLCLPKAAADWILDNLRPSLAADLDQKRAARASLESALQSATREADTLLGLRLRDQIDDHMFEEKRREILDRQTRLRLQLDQPQPAPDELLGRLAKILDFSRSAPEAFAKGDAVQRRQIVRTVTSNLRVQGRKALYKANEPFSFFEGSGLISRWCTIVEDLRTWVLGTEGLFVPNLRQKLGQEHATAT
jgi:site-specific DNA recombinase